MQHGRPSGSIIRQHDPRFTIDVPASLATDGGASLPARLINLSRHGFRVMTDAVYPAGQPVRLDVDGWPRLQGRVVWCDKGRLGCMFDTPPADTLFSAMLAEASDIDRREF